MLRRDRSWGYVGLVIVARRCVCRSEKMFVKRMSKVIEHENILE